ncbi:hypothetical protein PHYSODRAFT_510520 [Phytophthora sojae]|uniref:Uncharacterized protein n=1 Tax=Phytophthora sojae (strain P6497) TaxID=1094619 RepID=G4ZT23_PHYSP|nr:hypothetical protein PHYSODRAFT_510520 [Phytophthora sojae]EGZ12840.1 hypothetical protein PHYSODRAFT_510520 [Phytophthora sojae]|eukprot:XP_009530269.1 hypothetical protein PHYSODRAFT_510520 [Phytophthora sojae]
MSIASLAPANSKKSRTTALNSFNAFLECENVTTDAAHKLIGADKTGKVLKIMLDKYAYSLARSTDKVLSTNTCLAYFGNVKNWLLDKYPQQGAIVKPQLQKILSGLGKYCSNREDGALEKMATPCSKQDLENIVRLL